MTFSHWDALEEQVELKLFSQDVFSLSQRLSMLQVVKILCQLSLGNGNTK